MSKEKPVGDCILVDAVADRAGRVTSAGKPRGTMSPRLRVPEKSVVRYPWSVIRGPSIGLLSEPYSLFPIPYSLFPVR